jgi:hypothetical protein
MKEGGYNVWGFFLKKNYVAEFYRKKILELKDAIKIYNLTLQSCIS